MERVLVLFAHPAFEKSRVNRLLASEVRELPGVTFHDLYESYPDFDIDVLFEQKLLESHEVIVFQHPFYWYSTPAILKEWQDLVLEHGWAYGSQGHALEGKRFFNVVSTGAREGAYCKEGANRFTMRELLAPIEQTARLCGMIFLPPFAVHGTHGMSREEIQGHCRDYRRVVEAFRDGRIQVEKAKELSRLNIALDRVIRD